MPGFPAPVLVLAAAVIFFGGIVKGVAGFGYAIASTALLATFLSPSTAVVVMVIPMLVANLSLLGELDSRELRRCVVRFWPYVTTAMVGTVLGMFVLESIPTVYLTGGLGVFTLLYVVVKQPWYPIPGESLFVEYCFTSGPLAKSLLGFGSGLVFGVSNIAVQVVAYLDSLSLDRPTFVGVLAMILVGISGVRVGLAWTFGMYQTGNLLVVSVIASLPGLAGVRLGRQIRTFVPNVWEQRGVLGLLVVIGLRLLSRAVPVQLVLR
jgi:uncharacterized membrane protein YfcA